ncbi:unnamed protein product [Didymodactylos carnosus]|uniref:Uncharacterized protein n=1 Tax=Didymodactylos carnosus TaxID=1234261 RepID=A0A813TKL2_9BILA|nr:unnamed protein product [Didymodactylos carnosus]CAF1090410.1 unnamed protein product [Didymodactylos carnosus]CAF3596722.1 unnamed protein product [Didymodactylos carnosus]CAF3852124.1 unnamed protein product [Didymodactylos carnosus]
MRNYEYENPAFDNNQEVSVRMSNENGEPVRMSNGNDEREYNETSYSVHSPKRIPHQPEVEVGRTKLHHLLGEVLDKTDEEIDPFSKSEMLKRRRQRRRASSNENNYGEDSSISIIEDRKQQQHHIPFIAPVTDRPDPNIMRLRYSPYDAGDRAAEISRSTSLRTRSKYPSDDEDIPPSPSQTKYSQRTNNTLFINSVNNLPDRSMTSTDTFASQKRVPRTRIETSQEVLMRQNDTRNISDNSRERSRTAESIDKRRQHTFDIEDVYVDSTKSNFPMNENNKLRQHISRTWEEDQQQVRQAPINDQKFGKIESQNRSYLNPYEVAFDNRQLGRNDSRDKYLGARQSLVTTKNLISSIQGELKNITDVSSHRTYHD